MKSTRAAILAAAFLFPAAAQPLLAQDPRGLRDQPIPRELVEALLSGMMGRAAPSIVVGELPTPLVGKLFIPPRARVLGGTYSNASATAVLVSTDSPDSLAAQFQRELPKMGWTWLSRPIASMFSSRGFRDAPNPAAPAIPPVNAPITYCGSGATLTVKIDPQGFAENRIIVSSGGGNLCSMLQDQIQLMGPGGGPHPVPELINPVGARTVAGSGGCPDDNFNYGAGGGETMISTQATVEELFAHYGRQLADSGWKSTTSVSVSRSWSRDTTSILSEVSLTIKTFPGFPSCRRLTTELHGRTH
jgi:hypothetical protein